MPQQRLSAAWSIAVAAIGFGIATMAWTSGAIGGNGLEGLADQAVEMAGVGDPGCRSALTDFAHAAARASAAYPLPSAIIFNAERDRAGEAYVAGACPTGPLLAVMVQLRAAQTEFPE